MIRPEEVFRIGRLGKPHGVKGEMVFMFDDDIFDRTDADYLVVETEGILVPFFISEYRFRNNETALMKLDGVDTVEQARQLTNCEVFFPRRLAQTDEEELTWAQIAGFTLVDEPSGTNIGEIRSVDDSTENVLFEVLTPEGRELLVPAADEFIRGVDGEGRQIFVELPQGLLDL